MRAAPVLVSALLLVGCRDDFGPVDDASDASGGEATDGGSTSTDGGSTSTTDTTDTGDGDGDTAGDGDGDGAGCGWDAAMMWYDCGQTGEDPMGNFPLACPPSAAAGLPCADAMVTYVGCCTDAGHLLACDEGSMRVELTTCG